MQDTLLVAIEVDSLSGGYILQKLPRRHSEPGSSDRVLFIFRNGGQKLSYPRHFMPGWSWANQKGAPGVSIHFTPLATFAQLFHTSAFDADNWPPLANEVSIAA